MTTLLNTKKIQKGFYRFTAIIGSKANINFKNEIQDDTTLQHSVELSPFFADPYYRNVSATDLLKGYVQVLELTTNPETKSVVSVKWQQLSTHAVKSLLSNSLVVEPKAEFLDLSKLSTIEKLALLDKVKADPANIGVLDADDISTYGPEDDNQEWPEENIEA